MSWHLNEVLNFIFQGHFVEIPNISILKVSISALQNNPV